MRLRMVLPLLAGLCFAPGVLAQGVKRPNIVFVAIDDLNDWIGVLGKHPQAKTPNLDRLAQKTVLFTRAYCSAPACNPSRTAILTGLQPASTGVYHNNQPWRPALPDAVTLPEYLAKHGYRVWGGGKIFHYQDAKCWSEYFKTGAKDESDPEGDDPKKGKKKAGGGGIGGNMTWGPLNIDDKDMPDGKLTAWASKKLREKQNEPFFLAVGYVKPHLSWHVPKKYFDMHPLAQIQLPKTLDTDLDDVPPAGVKMARPQGDHKKIVEAGVWKEAVQAYLASCTFLDTQVGLLMEALEKGPNAEDTILILWSDHGWSHGQKQHWRKFSLWEQDCRVVFMISAPGVTRPGLRCQRTVNLIDIFPTINELCQLPARKDNEGHSLAPLLKNPEAEWPHASLTTHGRNNHSIRNERWRYIRYADGSDELYDHQNDPLEWRNLAKDAQFTAMKEELSRALPKVNAPDVKAVKEKKIPGSPGWD